MVLVVVVVIVVVVVRKRNPTRLEINSIRGSSIDWKTQSSDLYYILIQYHDQHHFKKKSMF